MQRIFKAEDDVKADFKIDFEKDSQDDSIINFSDNMNVDLNREVDFNRDVLRMDDTEDNQAIDLNDGNAEMLNSALSSFKENTWSDLSLDDQKQSMITLADCVSEMTGNENPPEVIFRDDMGSGEYGGYNPGTNCLEINENMLADSSEAADTVAHEMWHAYQQQCALDPTNERCSEYRDGFENYIHPEYDYEAYQSQMIEAEARAFAQHFKDRLTQMKRTA